MDKKSVDVKSQYIPHPMQMFLVGTHRPDGSPNFGPYCWLSFCWDGELSITLCMDGEKSAKDDIRRTGVFSANLVTEEMLPLTDQLASTRGEDRAEIIRRIIVSEGQELPVPILEGSPLCYELKLKQTIHLNGSDLFVCQICNALVADDLMEDGKSYELSKAAPIIVSQKDYYRLRRRRPVGGGV